MSQSSRRIMRYETPLRSCMMIKTVGHMHVMPRCIRFLRRPARILVVTLNDVSTHFCVADCTLFLAVNWASSKYYGVVNLLGHNLGRLIRHAENHLTEVWEHINLMRPCQLNSDCCCSVTKHPYSKNNQNTPWDQRGPEKKTPIFGQKTPSCKKQYTITFKTRTQSMVLYRASP